MARKEAWFLLLALEKKIETVGRTNIASAEQPVIAVFRPYPDCNYVDENERVFVALECRPTVVGLIHSRLDTRLLLESNMLIGYVFHIKSQVTRSLLNMGCYSVSLGDTIGAGTAGSTSTLLDALRAAGVSTTSLAVHFHDTYGQALANTLVALEKVRYHLQQTRSADVVTKSSELSGAEAEVPREDWKMDELLHCRYRTHARYQTLNFFINIEL